MQGFEKGEGNKDQAERTRQKLLDGEGGKDQTKPGSGEQM
jgi:hypothetical protein